MHTALTNGGDQGKRRALDFYPTPPDVTEALIKYLDFANPIKIWEPACGDGAMAEVFRNRGHDVFSSDLRETGYGHGGIDFLSSHPIHCDAIITNPPFSLSEQFIIKALSHTSIVAMLLKSQFWHAAKRVQLFRKTNPSHVLALSWRPDFLSGERGGSPTMECIWTVWDNRPTAKPRGGTYYDILSRPS